MKPLSDQELSNLLARWRVPAPPPGLAGGVWARIDGRPLAWHERAWTFWAATACTALLWLAVLVTPPRAVTPAAADSLATALARAGGGR